MQPLVCVDRWDTQGINFGCSDILLDGEPWMGQRQRSATETSANVMDWAMLEPISLDHLDNQPFTWPGPTGCRQAVLCLHGLGGGPYEMRPLLPLLQTQGWAVEAIIYPGHDQPGPEMPASEWTAWYAAAEQAFDRLAARFDRVVVVGFSTGCPLALALALQRSVAALVLLSPFMAIARPVPWLPRAELLVPWVAPWLKTVHRTALAIADRVARDAADRVAPYRTFHLGAVQSALELIAQIRPRLGEIQVPTLIIQPRRDRVVDPAAAKVLLDSLGSAHKQWVWLERSDHILTLDYDRDQAIQAIGAFLSA
ncbi:MAG: alpha/beta fold hydrolase [Oscillatoriales cyanobacterium]|nr:MAG: alpha/beta fold hydrolase [Oscillatoriales cyanobacterium]